MTVLSLILETYEWDTLKDYAKKYENDRDSGTRSLISGINRNYFEPYVMELVFEFTVNANTMIERQIRRMGSIQDDVEETMAGELYADGYIATSQIGDFALLHRLKGAVNNLVMGKAASQGLDQWLFDINKARTPQEIKKISTWQNSDINEKQKEAVEKILSVPDVCLIQGPPGTGKTTVINGIIKTYADLHGLDLKKSDLPIILAAPTGRAARRMNELTQLPSATIHRHLGLNSEDDFKTLEDYLDCDLIIIDEFSMVDTWLANQLFESISDSTQVIIVGDQDQLPSVGPGQVLADLLQIDNLPKVSLTKIFRQSEDSTIVTLASQMRQGQLPADFTEKKADRSYFEANANHIPQMVPKIVSAAIKSGIAAQDVQILAPMYRGQAGINNLNTIMQDLLNPQEKANQFAFNDIFFRKNDKILHLVNDTELNVFNGDIGIITDLIPGKYTESKQDEIYMSFDGNEVIYPRNEWNKITLAYAMSIHKSQGSEFPVVILPITRQSGRMLQRNLIYTAITRAKSKLVMLGEIAAFDYAVHNEGAKRNTYLIQRFEQTYTQAVDKSVEKIVTNEAIDASNQTKKENNGSSEPLENKDISGNINPSPTLINTYSQPVDKSVNKPVQTEENYRLTEDNWSTIDPMIGLSEDDIAAFFNNN